MRRYLFLALAIAGCSWTRFDDLGKDAWAQSTQSPNIGSTDYAVSILGTTSGATGGQLSVLSNDTVTYSTLTYDVHGHASLGPTPTRLAMFNITSLGTTPIFAASTGGDCAAVAQATSGSGMAPTVYNGCATTPGAETITTTPPPPAADAAAYVGSTLVVAAGPNLFVSSPTSFLWCAAQDDTLAPLAVAGMAGDTQQLWVWAQSGKLLSYKLSDLMGCVATSTNPTAGTTVLSFTPPVMTGFAVAPGASVQLVGNFAVLAGHAPQSATARVFVASIGTTLALVGTPLMADGLQSMVAGDLGGAGNYVALGFPANGTGGTVDIHALDTAGMVSVATEETLADAQPDSGEQFGRSLALMKFNGVNVLVVAAKSEVFAYFQTLLYPETRQK